MLENFFLSTLQDLTDLSSPSGNGLSPMDPDSIAGELRKNPYFKNVVVSSPGEGLYQGGLNFREIEELFYNEDGSSGSIALFEENARDSTLSIRISKDNFSELFRLFPVLQDPGFQYFLPEETISRMEYIDMLQFLFEDRFTGNQQELKTRIERASLSLSLLTGGDITSHTGGSLAGARLWKVEVPLLDLLLHDRELFYSVTFKK